MISVGMINILNLIEGHTIIYYTFLRNLFMEKPNNFKQ